MEKKYWLILIAIAAVFVVLGIINVIYSQSYWEEVRTIALLDIFVFNFTIHDTITILMIYQIMFGPTVVYYWNPFGWMLWIGFIMMIFSLAASSRVE